MTDTFFPNDDHPFRYLDGRPLEDPAAVFKLGELPVAPRVFGTRARLIDRLGEVITGEVVAVIPA